MKQKLKAYKVIVSLKSRAVERAALAASICAHKVSAAQVEVKQAEEARVEALKILSLADDARLNAMHATHGFSAEEYMSYIRSRDPLVERVGIAAEAIVVAERNVLVQQSALADARRATVRAKESLKISQDMQSKLQIALENAAELAGDEDAVEAFVGRRYSRRGKRAASTLSASDVDSTK
jgi:hypothetical protein